MLHSPAPAATRDSGQRIASAAVFALLMLAPVASAEAQNGSLMRVHQPAVETPQRDTRPGASIAMRPPTETSARTAPMSGTIQRAAARAAQPALAPPPGSRGAPAGGAEYADQPYAPQGIPLTGASWTYVPPAEVRTYRKNDIVTIRVDELSRMQAEGNAESRRNGLYDTVLKDWIKLDGLDEVRPAPQSSGDPRVQGTLNQLSRADSSLESRESLSFNAAARIVDIRPNGDLVLEARKTIKVNENIWETELTGICRPADIAPDNVVLSRDLLDLQIHKQDRGRLRDGYRRGWFTRWFETLSPF